jgi:hypothetical protein
MTFKHYLSIKEAAQVLEEKKKKKKKSKKRSSKRYGWGYIGYGYPGLYDGVGDAGGGDGGVGE